MKQIIKIFGYLLCCGLLLSCFEEECMVEHEVYRQVLVHPADLKDLIKFDGEKALEQVGKINFYKNYVFIGEANEGIHLIDISDPTNPDLQYFWEIPGLGDMGIQNDVLYASQYTDLIALDIRNIHQPKEINRKSMAFDNFSLLNDSIYVGYEPTGETKLVPCYGGDIYLENVFLNDSPITATGNGGSTRVSTGLAGSLATFALTQEQMLYTLNSSTALKSFDLRNNLVETSDTKLDWTAETLFPYKDLLYVGTQQGMIIMSLEDREIPKKLSDYRHWVSCDPVVVDDEYAYLTLRNGRSCRGGVNQLQVISVQDPIHPELKDTYPLSNPHGLGLGRQESLFVCDGDEGLKVFDRDNSPILHLIENFPNMKAIDVIALNQVLILIAEEGLYLYDYKDLHDIKLLSEIPIK